MNLSNKFAVLESLATIIDDIDNDISAVAVKRPSYAAIAGTILEPEDKAPPRPKHAADSRLALKTWNKENSPRWFCKICEPPAEFSSEQSLKRHEIDAHEWCLQCNKIFRTKEDRNIHLAIENHLPAPIRCISGECEFNSEDGGLAGALQHIETNTCPSGLKGNDIMQWIVEHDRHNIITIPGVSKKFSEWEAAVEEFSAKAAKEAKLDANEAFTCSICSKKFKLLGELNSHLASPTIHLPRMFRCAKEDCCQTFSSLSSLVRHMDGARSDCGARKEVMGPFRNAIRRQLMIAKSEKTHVEEPELYKRAFQAVYPSVNSASMRGVRRRQLQED